MSLVTFLTDFGAADYFVGAMKGALLSVCQRATIVDLTHEIAPFDIEAGAFALLATYTTFPAGTIHVAVVDPGVGSSRRALVMSAGGQFFVAPDNGLLSWIAEREAGNARFFHATNAKYFRATMSQTFHGRDVFAPLAGALANDVAPQEFGEEINEIVRLPALSPERIDANVLRGRVIHVDRFGNLVTNVRREDLPTDFAACASLQVSEIPINSFHQCFAEAAPEEIFAYWGSAGFLEIGVANDSAARRLAAGRGAIIQVNLAES